MKYMGSKQRYAKYLLPIIMKGARFDRWYIEPFVGGFNMMDKVYHALRMGNDINFYLMSLYRAVRDGWEPPKFISEEEYKDIKNNIENYPPELVGFAGIGCAYSGQWFGTYARGNDGNGKPRNYCDESRRNILKQIENLKDVMMLNYDYRNLWIPKNSIVYCDPPYAKRLKYKDDFDNSKFWEWARVQAKTSKIYISELEAPEDFKCIWRMPVKCTVASNSKINKRVEKLFIHESQTE